MELVISALALLVVTVAASVILYRRIVDATREYEGSRDGVRNITFGFTRQVNKLQQEVAKVSDNATTAKVVAAEALKTSGEAKEATLKGLQAVQGLQVRVESAENAVESMRKEVQKLSTAPRPRAPQGEDVSAPIPVQGGNILAQLTDTELSVLRKIGELGEGAVPEIRQHIGLTREHTARMLKKLYESGYVDRSTNAMPYRYSVRKEIQGLIQAQPEQKPAL